MVLGLGQSAALSCLIRDGAGDCWWATHSHQGPSCCRQAAALAASPLPPPTNNYPALPPPGHFGVVGWLVGNAVAVLPPFATSSSRHSDVTVFICGDTGRTRGEGRPSLSDLVPDRRGGPQAKRPSERAAAAGGAPA